MGRKKGSTPWNKGKKGMQVAWNKGKKTPQSVRKKLSLAKKGKKHNMWKGGRIKEGYGYILIHSPSHPHANNRGYVREHRLVMEEHLGRFLKPSEVIHHIDGNKENNKINNLMLFPTKGAHRYFHIKFKGGDKHGRRKSCNQQNS